MPSQQSAVLSTDPNETYVPELYVICSLFPALATIAVGLRFISRRLKGVNFWWDDWTALLALLLAWADYATVIQSVHHGKGRHLALLHSHDKTMISYWSFWFAIIYTSLPPTIKISALLLYRRIFKNDGFNHLVTAMLIIVFCWGVSGVLVSIFGCTPVRAFWTHKGKCIDEHKWVLGYGIPNIILDVTVWAMPIPRIWTLKLPQGQKITLTCIFLIGLMDCALAIVRLTGSAQMLGDADTSYKWAPAMWWAVIHTCLGIIVISLPTMRILVTKASLRISTLRTSKNSYSSSTALTTIKPSRANYVTMEDVGISLSGENDSSLHSNAIALALSKGPGSNSEVLKSGINVHSEFTLEDSSADDKVHVREGI